MRWNEGREPDEATWHDDDGGNEIRECFTTVGVGIGIGCTRYHSYNKSNEGKTGENAQANCCPVTMHPGMLYSIGSAEKSKTQYEEKQDRDGVEKIIPLFLLPAR